MIKTNMAKIKIAGTAICLALQLSAAGLHSQSVEYVRTIDFKKLGSKKSIGSFLLGKKDTRAIIPGSLHKLDPQLLAVTDAVNGAVIIMDRKGKIKKRITRFKGGYLASPVSVCSDDGGNIYISDSARQAVLKYDKRFKFKRVFIAQPNTRITGILFSEGLFFCVDTHSHRILCFDREGKQVRAFGSRGPGSGQFNYPTHIATGSGRLFVTDAMNFRVQVFDKTGKFIRSFGRMGRGGGNFSKPKGLAVDPGKHIYVADAMFDNIQIFNMKGEFLYYFGGPGHEDGLFWMPADVLVDSDNTIWVADSYNSRIQVFKLIQETP